MNLVLLSGFLVICALGLALVGVTLRSVRWAGLWLLSVFLLYNHLGSWADVEKSLAWKHCDRLLANPRADSAQRIDSLKRHCPDHPIVRHMQAMQYYQQGDFAQAAQIWTDLIQDPALEAVHPALEEMRRHAEEQAKQAQKSP